MSMAKETLLHLVEYLEQGGIERLLDQLTLEQAKTRRVVIYTYETPELAGIAKEISARGIPVFADKKSNGYDFSLLARLRKRILAENVTTIHTHDFGPIEYAIALKVLFPRLKLIHTQHTLQNLIPNRKYRLFIQLSRFFYQSFVAVSETVALELRKHCPLLKGFIRTIPNGVNTHHFVTTKRLEQGSQLNLLSISRISHEKNLSFLLEVCAWLKDQGIPVRLTHVGSGPVVHQSDLLQQVRDLKLRNEVEFVGFQNDVRPFLARSDIFLSGSLTEGMPVSVLEAMSAGKPCVLSDIPPHRKFQNPLIKLSPLNATIFGASILELWNARAHWEEKTPSLQAYVKNEFSLQKMVQCYEECYV